MDPFEPALGATIDRLREALPVNALVGGAAAENHDLEQALAAKTIPVLLVVLALGFALLLVAGGVVTNLLATGAAFGVARLIFQDGHGSGLLGFEPQGFLNALAPVFFFAMIVTDRGVNVLPASPTFAVIGGDVLGGGVADPPALAGDATAEAVTTIVPPEAAAWWWPLRWSKYS